MTRRRLLTAGLATALCFAFLAPAPGHAAEVRRFAVNHAAQVGSDPPRVRVYLDLLDAEGKPVDGVETQDLSASLGEQPVQLAPLEPFAETGEGVAYIFLVDISRSLDGERFDRIRAALDEWIDQLEPKDRAAILAFGEESRLVADFTDDSAALHAALASLGPTDSLTVIHRALRDALELGQRRDADLPLRRVLVLLTDGRDEGSGLALEDVLLELRENPLPIYAIGYSRLREPQRSQYLEVLQRLASNSGGAFFEAEQTRFAEAYAAIRQAVDRVWVTELECRACVADGSAYRLQLDLTQGDRVLSQGVDVRLFPGRGEGGADATGGAAGQASGMTPAASPAGSEASSPTAGSKGAPAGAPSEPAQTEAGSGWNLQQPATWPWWLWALGGFLLLLLLLLILAGRKPKPPREGDELPPPISLEDVEVPPPVSSNEPLALRLIVVRGSHKGREYRLRLDDRATVGKRSSCDCVLVEEETIAPEQFALERRGGEIWIRDLSGRGSTRVGGRPLAGERQVTTGDLVGNQETILRLVVE
ncbi:MAG: VWA domain-containing protein [Acidobacteria bacterium]|nr:VWA domain-containing protein [Acidobacteriota bacterium]